MMKSIKEFSKEWCCEQHNLELAFEAGANYVLEEVKKNAFKSQ